MVYRHGLQTVEAVAERRALRELLRESWLSLVGLLGKRPKG